MKVRKEFMNKLVCAEVNAVLQNLNEREKSKIPQNIFESFENKSKDINYELKYDKSLNPIISKEASYILLIIYRQCFLKEKEKAALNKALKKNELIKEELKRRFLNN